MSKMSGVHLRETFTPSRHGGENSKCDREKKCAEALEIRLKISTNCFILHLTKRNLVMSVFDYIRLN